MEPVPTDPTEILTQLREVAAGIRDLDEEHRRVRAERVALRDRLAAAGRAAGLRLAELAPAADVSDSMLSRSLKGAVAATQTPEVLMLAGGAATALETLLAR